MRAAHSPGVGAARKLTRFLKVGDVVTITIEKIGLLTDPASEEVREWNLCSAYVSYENPFLQRRTDHATQDSETS